MSKKREIRNTLKPQIVSLQQGTIHKKAEKLKSQAETVQHAEETKNISLTVPAAMNC
jgi:5-formyltetrahydrofolate cyclo-ligase